ncbi:MAG: NeuD/PglB/VioB family sugar acetyltransferase [Verrucomicrobiales bacterium]
MKRLAIAGGGDLGRQIAHLAQQLGEYVPVLYDDTLENTSREEGLSIRGRISDIQKHFENGEIDTFIMGIGYKHMTERHRLFLQLSNHIPPATLIHPSATIDPTAVIGPGTAILATCTIDLEASIGRNCYLNPGCLIAHHSAVSDNVFMGPKVTLAGFVEVSSHCFLGISTTVIDHTKIGENIQTGAGAVVTRNISDRGLYLGLPAKAQR